MMMLEKRSKKKKKAEAGRETVEEWEENGTRGHPSTSPSFNYAFFLTGPPFHAPPPPLGS